MTNAAVLTISDSVSAGTRSDRSGPPVRERLEQLGWRVSVMEVIPDVASEISERLATLPTAVRLPPFSQPAEPALPLAT